MKVLFLQDNGLSESLGICTLSAILKLGGHDVQLLIEREEKDLAGEMRRIDPDIVGFSCTTGQHWHALQMAQRVKAWTNAFTIMGGSHPTFCPDVLRAKELDAICIGEGDYALRDLVDGMDSDCDIRSIPNIHVKSGGQIYRNDVRPLVENLDDIPMLDRSIYYDRYAFLRDMPMKRFMSGRGCMGRCAFCHNSVIASLYRGKGPYIRKVSPERLLREIEGTLTRYPLETVHMSDDTFVVHKQWAEDFLGLYAQKLRIRFTCNVAIDLIDEDIARWLAHAGCCGVTFGLETWDESFRKQVLRKRFTNEEAARGVRLLRNQGITVLTSNMIGLPGQTPEDVLNTIEHNRKLGVTMTRHCIAMPYDGTDIERYGKEHGYLSATFSASEARIPLGQSVFRTPYKREMENLYWLFGLAVLLSLPRWLLRILIKCPTNRFFRACAKVAAFNEKRFYRVGWYAGLRFRWHVGNVLEEERSGVGQDRA